MKLSRIVVGVDLCRPSVDAARWTALEFAPDAEIVLVHAVDLPRPPRVVRGAMAPADRVVENARLGARARLAELGSWVDETRVVTDVVVGHPSDCLVMAADTRAADLLVVGDHGCERGAWEFLGTTAEHVVQESAVPVLVARGPLSGPPLRILAAVDPSSAGRRALSWAAFLGLRLNAEVVALHAVQPVVHAPVELIGVMPTDEMQEDLTGDAERWLGDEAREACDGRASIECRVAVGEPVDEIVEAIAREHADLTVIGSHGAPSPVGAVLGSVARAVLRGTNGPVLVVGPLGR
jgi:nucleotide-binding universal stress UspA family protein